MIEACRYDLNIIAGFSRTGTVKSTGPLYVREAPYAEGV
jgi:hypothetical protein